MPIRTTDVLVKEVLAGGRDYDRKRNPSLDIYIRTGSALVDRLDARLRAKGTVLEDPHLELLETWLAAHAYKMSDQQRSSQSVDGASSTFGGQTGKGLQATKYGQQALDLDWTGELLAITSGGDAAQPEFWCLGG